MTQDTTVHDAAIAGGGTVYDAAVAGGGPAGLAAALALHKAGARVVLVAPPPPQDFRTSALLAGSMQLLHDTGSGADAEAAGSPLKTMRIIDGTRRLVRAPEVAFSAEEAGLAAFGTNIANADLTGILGAALTDAGVPRISELAASYRFEGPAAEITTQSGARVQARLLVAADGRRSPLREVAGIAVHSWSYPQSALVCNIRHTADHHDTSTEFHTESGPFTLVPNGPKRSSVVCVVAPAVADYLIGLDDAALAAEFDRRSSYLLGRTTIDGQRQVWPMSSMVARRATATRVALVSEAAHAFPPIGAQGLNLGLRDIAVLAETVRKALAAGQDPGGEDVLAAYEQKRRLDVGSRTVAVDLLNRSLLSSMLPVQLARNIGLNLARSVTPFRKL